MLYPNPVNNIIESELPLDALSLISTTGIKYSPIKINAVQWDASFLPAGFYIAISVKDGVVEKVRCLNAKSFWAIFSLFHRSFVI